MINLVKMSEYFSNQIEKSDGIIHNMFLANSENEILTTGNGNQEQASILSTLVNDSMYIISKNFEDEERPREDIKPMQMNLSISPNEQVILFNIKNQFIFGVQVNAHRNDVGHKMATQLMKYMTTQLDEVIQINDNMNSY